MSELDTAIEALVREASATADELDGVPEWVHASGADIPRSRGLRSALSALRAARRPTTLLGLLPWLVLVCEDGRRGAWWMRYGGDDAIACDGRNALIVRGAARSAEPGLVPESARDMSASQITKVIGPMVDAPALLTVSARALRDRIASLPQAAWYAEEVYLRVGCAELSPAALRLWALPVLALCQDADTVTVKGRGERDPVVFETPSWTLLVMPSARGADETRAESVAIEGASMPEGA